ncbi:MAG: hypothetical protein Q4E88_02755 [Coriobacteriia bacterium]|nr:hypothetical protein [Coriobacteriia bacterium]
MRDVEKTIIDFLNDEIEDIHTYSDAPEKNRPNEFITVEIQNKNEDSFISKSTVAIQCWSNKRVNASKLAHRVCSELIKLVNIDYVSKCKIENFLNFPDLQGKIPRYQIVAYVVTTG